MDYLYLTLAVVLVAGTNILGKLYNQKNAGGAGAAPLYTLILVSAAFVFWLCAFIFKPQYDMAVLPYAVIFSLCYVFANAGLIYALKYGSVTFTSLFGKMSLILVAVWGFFFWNEGLTPLSFIGLILCALSVFLCLYKGREGRGVNLYWLFFVLLFLLGNAGCSIAQKTQQMNFDGKYGAFMMLLSTGMSVIICAFIYLFSDRCGIAATKSLYIPTVAGLMSAGMNLLVIILATSSLSASLVYPTLASGGLILVSVFGIFIFREKMSPRGFVGVALGLIATAILSL